jgi:hypothetical protein
MVRTALIDSGNPAPILKKYQCDQRHREPGRPFFAVIRERHRQNCTARMLAPLPGSGALWTLNFRPLFQERE